MRTFLCPAVLRPGTLILAAVLTFVFALPSSGTHRQGDTEVTVGSNDRVFSQNKQNEPAVAIHPLNPLIIAAGANDNIDLEACNVGNDTTCPFTDGVGVSGVQFSFDGGRTWTQPVYAGFSARNCLGVAGDQDATCTPVENGPIGTLPRYRENGLVSDGDPIVAFGPRPGSNGTFSWTNGVRLYYSNLTSNFSTVRDEIAFRGFEAIAVSRTDDIVRAAAGNNNAWEPPVLVSRQSGTAFSDKETIWADNAQSMPDGKPNPHFGNVYVCWVSFGSVGLAAAPEPVKVARSTDGGTTWEERQISQSANTILGQGRQGCTVRTDSYGVVYVFWLGASQRKDNPPIFNAAQLMSRSFDGGISFETPREVAGVQECGLFDPNQRRFTFDGLGGARTNSFPSVDIANGAPSGAGATNLIVMTWCDGPTPDSPSDPNEQAQVQWSTNGGETWSTTPVNAAEVGDRPDFPALAISPDGTDVYLTYMAFHAPWQSTNDAPRLMEGVVRHANATSTSVGAFGTLHRGRRGDARGSSANALFAEFLGDYNYVDGTNDGAVAVWNDVRNASACAAIDEFRQAFATATPLPRPAPQQECRSTFGNSDIFGARFTDPTP